MTGQSRLSLSSLFRFIRLSSRSVSLALPERVSTHDRQHGTRKEKEREREREREANVDRGKEIGTREAQTEGDASVAAATWLSVRFSVALCGHAARRRALGDVHTLRNGQQAGQTNAFDASKPSRNRPSHCLRASIFRATASTVFSSQSASLLCVTDARSGVYRVGHI